MISIENYFFSEVSVIANQDYRPDDNIKELIDENTVASGNAFNDEDGNNFRVILDLKIESSDEVSLPYDIHVTAFGVFSIEHITQFAHINGMTILYGAVRDLVMTLTSRGPWGAVVLRAQHFSPEKKENSDQNKNEEE